MKMNLLTLMGVFLSFNAFATESSIMLPADATDVHAIHGSIQDVVVGYDQTQCDPISSVAEEACNPLPIKAKKVAIQIGYKSVSEARAAAAASAAGSEMGVPDLNPPVYETDAYIYFEPSAFTAAQLAKLYLGVKPSEVVQVSYSLVTFPTTTLNPDKIIRCETDQDGQLLNPSCHDDLSQAGVPTTGSGVFVKAVTLN